MCIDYNKLMSFSVGFYFEKVCFFLAFRLYLYVCVLLEAQSSFSMCKVFLYLASYF